jgi:hypothetical protein
MGGDHPGEPPLPERTQSSDIVPRSEQPANAADYQAFAVGADPLGPGGAFGDLGFSPDWTLRAHAIWSEAKGRRAKAGLTRQDPSSLSHR